MPSERLSDEEIARRAAEARRLRDADRAHRRSVLDELQSQQRQSMGIGHSSDWDALLGGALQGAALNWGDELFGGMRDFKADRAANPGAYDAAALLGMMFSPAAMIGTRLPLMHRERLYNEARGLLEGEGLAQRALAKPSAARGADMLPFGDRRFAAELPYVTPQTDIEHLTSIGRNADARRLSFDRADALDEAEQLLGHRRAALDRYSGIDALAHGAAIGSGGVDPGDTSIEERAGGGILGALGAYGLTKGANEAKDLTGYLVPGRGARLSAREVVDLPGKSYEPADVQDFYKRLRMFSEQAFREATHDTFLGRSAGPSSTMRSDPNVAPIHDSNTMIQGAIAKAQQTGPGREAARALDDELAVMGALERFGGVNTKAERPIEDLLPSHQRVIPQAMREDPMVRQDALRTVMGDEKFFPGEGVKHPVDPAMHTERQADDFRMRRRGRGQYPGLDQPQRQELAHRVIEDARAQAHSLARLPREQQPGAARKLLEYLDDPNAQRLWQALALREGRTGPHTQALAKLKTRLSQIAGHGTSYEQLTHSFHRGKGRFADAIPGEAASMLANYPMSRRMAEAILDKPALTTKAESYWVNPAQRGEEPLLQVRRESERPPWPYAAPAGYWTQRGGDALAYGLDHLVHALSAPAFAR